MGKLTYENSIKVDIDDRALAHLQLVMSTKLRRRESFHFSWKEDPSLGGGRVSVWVHPAANLVFKYYGARPAHINHAWVQALAYTANSPTGLYLVPEPAESRDGSDLVEVSA